MVVLSVQDLFRLRLGRGGDVLAGSRLLAVRVAQAEAKKAA